MVSTDSFSTQSSGRLRFPSLGAWGTVIALAGAWLLLIAVTATVRPDFLSHQTVLAVAFTMAVVGTLAVGQALVAISGSMVDISQPTSLILSALVAVRLLEADVAVGLAVAVAILAGAAWGILNALVIVYGKINPVIVTLATNFVGLAALFLIFQIAESPIDSSFRAFGLGNTLGLPNIWWPMVALILVVGFFLPRTRYGRRAIAVGGNPFAAKARGISLRKTRFSIFAFAGASAGLAGVLFACSSGPFTPSGGVVYLLPVIAAVILAGITLGGGRGNLWILLLSVGFLSTVPTSLVFLGLSSDWQAVIQGFILVVAVSIDGYRERRSAR